MFLLKCHLEFLYRCSELNSVPGYSLVQQVVLAELNKDTVACAVYLDEKPHWIELHARDVCAAGIKTFVHMASLSRHVVATMPSFCDDNL